MAAKIVWSPEALEDLRQITEFIALDRPSVAHRVGLSLLAAVEMLGQMPKLGRRLPERPHPAIREFVQRPYRIIYRIIAQGRTIRVERIWHAGRGTPEWGHEG